MGFFDGYDQAYIDAMNQEYERAQVKRSPYQPLPEGDYQVYVDRFGLKESKRVAGSFGLALDMVVIDGPYAGAHVSKFVPVDMENMERLKRDLETLQFRLDGDVTTLDDEDRRREMLDRIVDISVRKKEAANAKGEIKTYTNVYLNRWVGMYEHPVERVNGPDYGGYDAPPPWGR